MNTLKSNNKLTIEDVIPNDVLKNDETEKELDEIKEIEENVDRKKLIYEIREYTYSFKTFKTMETFGRDLYNGKINTEESDEYQKDLLVEIMIFKKHTKPRSLEKKQVKEIILKNLYLFLRAEKWFLTRLKSKYFQ